MRASRRALSTLLPSLGALLTTSAALSQVPPEPANAAEQAQVAAPTAPPPDKPRAPSIEVSDPLLSPVPPAAQTLSTWRDALTLIRSRSSDLRIAEQEIVRAEALSRQALAAALPRLVVSGSVTHHFITGEVGGVASEALGVTLPSTPTALAQVTASQPILALRTWHAIGTSERTVDAAKRTFEDRQRTAVVTVASAIVVVVTSERVAEINRVGLRSSLERLELMKRRLRVGSGTSLDIVRAEQDLALARANLLTGDEALRKAREALGLSLGSSDPYGVTPSISLDEVEQSTRELCAATTPDARADVLAEKTRLDIAERGVTEAELAYAPTADLSTTVSYSSENIVPNKHYAWSIQGVLTWSLWDGGARYGAVRSAKASVEQQRELVDVAARGSTLEAAQAVRAVGVAADARDLSRRSAELARESARLSQVAFDAGASTSFELVDAARRQREADLDLAVKEFQLVSAKITSLLATTNCKY